MLNDISIRNDIKKAQLFIMIQFFVYFLTYN